MTDEEAYTLFCYNCCLLKVYKSRSSFNSSMCVVDSPVAKMIGQYRSVLKPLMLNSGQRAGNCKLNPALSKYCTAHHAQHIMHSTPCTAHTQTQHTRTEHANAIKLSHDQYTALPLSERFNSGRKWTRILNLLKEKLPAPDHKQLTTYSIQHVYSSLYSSVFFRSSIGNPISQLHLRDILSGLGLEGGTNSLLRKMREQHEFDFG